MYNGPDMLCQPVEGLNRSPTQFSCPELCSAPWRGWVGQESWTAPACAYMPTGKNAYPRICPYPSEFDISHANRRIFNCADVWGFRNNWEIPCKYLVNNWGQVVEIKSLPDTGTPFAPNFDTGNPGLNALNQAQKGAYQQVYAGLDALPGNADTEYSGAPGFDLTDFCIPELQPAFVAIVGVRPTPAPALNV